MGDGPKASQTSGDPGREATGAAWTGPVGAQAASAELVRVERLAAAEQLAAEVAHSINNPLAVLIGRLQMRLEKNRPADPEDAVLLRLARRIDRTVAGLLELSSRPALRPGWTPLADLLQDALRPVAARAERVGVKLETFVDPSVERVYADPGLLARALRAVADNALDASEVGGIVGVEAEALGGPGVVVFRVQDGGGGMSAEICDLASEPFFTTRPGQTGLGLTVAQKIVSAHGGRLRVRSAEHLGTLVTIELPLRAPARAAEDRD